MDRQDEILTAIARLEEKVDACREAVADVRTYTRDLSGRVRALEVFRGWVLGIGAALTALLGSLAALFKGGN